MSKNKVITILILIGVVIGVCYFIFSVVVFTPKSDMVCTQLKLQNPDDLKLIREKDIIHFLEEKNLNPKGKKLSEIQTEKIENALSKNAMIKNVECYSTPSGTIYVKIHERSPKFQVMTGSENYYVDKDGYVMPVSINSAVYVPIVTGRVTKTFASKELFDFIDFLERDDFWKSQIEQIDVNEDKTIELIPRVGDAVILLGDLSHFKEKMKKLHKLYTNGFNEIGWNRYSTIDLRFKDQVVCTKSNQLLAEESK